MCSAMEPCPWSLDVSGGVRREKPSDAGHVPCTGKEESGWVTVSAVRQGDKLKTVAWIDECTMYIQIHIS